MKKDNFFTNLDFKPCFIAYVFLSALAVVNMFIVAGDINTSLALHGTPFNTVMLPIYALVLSYIVLKPVFALLIIRHSRWGRREFNMVLYADAGIFGVCIAPFVIITFYGSLRSALLDLLILFLVMFSFLFVHIIFAIKRMLNASRLKNVGRVLLSAILICFSLWCGNIMAVCIPDNVFVFDIVCFAVSVALLSLMLIIPALKGKISKSFCFGIFLMGVVVCGFDLFIVLQLLSGEIAHQLLALNFGLLSVAGAFVAYLIAAKREKKA